MGRGGDGGETPQARSDGPLRGSLVRSRCATGWHDDHLRREIAADKSQFVTV